MPAPPRILATWALWGALVHAVFLPISTAGMQIGLGVSLAALLLLRVRGVRAAWARGPLDLPLLLLAGAAALSVLVAAATGSAPTDWHKPTSWHVVLSPLIVYSAIALPRALAPLGGETTELEVRRRALLVLCAWAFGSFAPSALAWVQYLTGFDPLYWLHLRSSPVIAPAPLGDGHYAAVGFFRWYTALAHNLLPPLCLAAALSLHRGLSRQLRLLFAAAAVAGAAAVVLTASRAAWATLVLGVLVAILLCGRGLRWAIPILVVAVLALVAHPALRARAMAIGERDAIQDRQQIWAVCAEMVKDRPLTGWGWGNVPARSLPYWQRLAPEFKLHAWCHDSFFTAWAEGGPLLTAALAVYWTLLFRAFWRWRRQGGLAQAAAAGAIGALAATLANSLVHDLFHSSEAALALGFVLAVGAALAAQRGVGTPSASR